MTKDDRIINLVNKAIVAAKIHDVSAYKTFIRYYNRIRRSKDYDRILAGALLELGSRANLA